MKENYRIRIEDTFRILRGGESFYITKEELRDWLDEAVEDKARYYRKVIKQLRNKLTRKKH